MSSSALERSTSAVVSRSNAKPDVGKVQSRRSRPHRTTRLVGRKIAAKASSSPPQETQSDAEASSQKFIPAHMRKTVSRITEEQMKEKGVELAKASEQVQESIGTSVPRGKDAGEEEDTLVVQKIDDIFSAKRLLRFVSLVCVMTSFRDFARRKPPPPAAANGGGPFFGATKR